MGRNITNEEFERARNNTDNQKIINMVCSKYAQQLSRDVLKQCGDCAIWECLQVHDEKRQKFTSSLYRYVNWNCLRELRAYKPCGIDMEFDDRISDDNIYEHSLDDYLRCLTPIERHIVKLKYENNYTLKDIAKFTGYSRQWISEVLHKSLSKIKKACEFGV